MLLFIIVLIVGVATGDVCLTRQGYVTSTIDTLCVECSFTGYLSDGLCITTITPPPTIPQGILPIGLVTNSTCASYTAVNSEVYCYNGTACVPSLFGVSCSECSYSGQLIISADLSGTICNCYSTLANPKTFCQNTLVTTSIIEQINVTMTYSRITCKAIQSIEFGCFNDVSYDTFEYGTINPPVPYECCSPYLGPSPGTIVETLIPGVPFIECNVYGAPDPDQRNSSLQGLFAICSGHGFWNVTSRTCECNEGWQLRTVGSYMINSTVYDIETCLDCYGHFGPIPDREYEDGFVEPPYCVAIYTPDPITGIDSECGGRGVYIENNGCVCYHNSTIGYWSLGPVGGKFALNQTEIFDESCVRCSNGTYPYCL